MNILVIGNGFDLAHNLPTKYEHFLKFMYSFLKYKTAEEEGKGLDLNDGEDPVYYKYFINLNNRKYDDELAGKIIEELSELASNNIWIEYFTAIYENRKQVGKDGWIDFESEISKVIQVLDDARQGIINQIKYGDGVILLDYQRDVLVPVIPDINEKVYIELSDIEKYKNILIDNLNRLIRCLEIYLSNYISSIEVTKRLPDIMNLSIDKVLSFNYTDTFKRLYNKEGTHEIEYDYIHGKADINKTLETCNLVLGIDEYLPENAKDTDNEFIQFKKFYQRIYKRTGCKYLDWVREPEFVGQFEEYEFSDSELNIFILGHSLDVTDKDILSSLINAQNAKTTIFYHDKKAFGKQIANLVKVIGQDNLISRVHGSNATIVFKEQQE